MSGSRSERQSSRRKLNRKRFLGALLGLTLTVGMFPSSMAVADTPDPSDTASAAESSVSSSPGLTNSPDVTNSPSVTQTPPTSASSSPEGQTTSSAQESTTDPTVETQAAVGALPAQGEVSQLSVLGPEADVGTPYVYWALRTAPSGNTSLIGGGSFELQGPRVSSQNWGTNYQIADCVSTPCTGYDKDPDPGEFQVPNGATGPQGTISMSTSQRWRLRPAGTPANWYFADHWYEFASSTSTWVEMGSADWSNGARAFGNFYASTVVTRDYTITVNKGTYRTGTGPDNVSADDTAGVRFGLFSSAAATTPLATCEISSANLGKCVFPQTALVAGAVAYIKELSPAPGSVAAAKLGEPLATLTTGTSTYTDRDYVIQYQLPSTGSTSVTVPVRTERTSGSLWNDQSGYFANRVANPTLTQSCSAGVKVGVLLDTSGSVRGFQNTLAKATTALVTGLTGTQSSVAMFSFDTGTPGRVVNHPVLQSVQTTAGANTVKSWYSSDTDGQTANFTPTGGTNWDLGLWTTAQGAQANDYDVVFVLTDGNPTFSSNGSSNSGDGSLTSFRELERAILSANAIKKTGARVITVGIGSNLSDYNLSSISGPSKYAEGKSLNEFDYISADWAQLEQVMKDFAQGLKCEATVTVEKQAKAYGGSFTAASGWEFGLGQTGAASQSPTSSSQTTGQSGQATWTLRFTHPDDEASVVLTESDSRTGWSLSDITCNVGDAEVNLANKTVTIAGIGIGENVKCTFKNEESRTGTLAITKAFDSSVPSGSGTSVVFNGAYTCTLGGNTVASGTWSRTGIGPATLTPAAGSPAANQIPVGASCSATETQPAGSDGLPNSSWEWDTYTVGPAVTIATNQTGTITVTNKAKRVYGNFQVTKLLAVGSTADTSNTYSGNWSCTLGTGASAETKTGTWGPIAAGATWTSTVSDQIPLGANCTVTSETRPDWPVAGDHSYQWHGDPTFSTGVTAAKDNLGTVTVTNKTKRIVGSATWSKVDSGSRALLAGSTWTLVGPNVPANTVVSDCTAAPCPTGAFTDQDPVAGQFKLTDLLAGGYTLTEKTAPPGYRLVDKDFTFTVDADHLVIDLGAIKNKPQDAAVLPLTGGLGRDAFLLGGTVLLLLAAGALVIRQRRARRVQQG